MRQLARRVLTLSALVAVVLGAGGPVPTVEAGTSYQRISGEGSSWAAGAIDAMRVNVKQFGITVDYNPSGSSAGRKNFLNGTIDFAASDIPFQFHPEDGSAPENPAPGSYAYMPVTAGGTSFMYNLKINGAQVTNLRLSGENVAKIFTGAITMWNDPALEVDNPGLSLPNRKIVPVVRSDGSGSSAQFTRWMINRHGSIWNAYCARSGRAPACGFTSYYPTIPGMIAQSGDLGVSGYVSQSFAEGAIGYVNYSYALGARFPVAKVLNAAGYYTEPTPDNVAVSLLKAKINNDSSSDDYLTQQLDGVYADTDPRNYQLSSYSYLILPTKVSGQFNEAKGKTLGAFSYYAMCQAQEQSASLGYSPMPINLVEASFDQIRKIPGVVVQDINIATCHNPTFSSDGTNLLAKNAPQPAACDKKGPVQCATGTGGVKSTPTAVAGPTGSGSGQGPSGTGGSGTNGAADPSAAGGDGATAVTTCDPDTGVCGTADPNAVGAVLGLQTTTLLAGSSGWSSTQTLAVLVLLLTLALVLAPALTWRHLSRRRTMSRASERARRVRNVSLVLLAVAAGLSWTAPAKGDSIPGSAGTDTSLPATASQVTVHGRGGFADLTVTVNQTADLTNQAISVTWTGGTPTTTGPGRFAGDYLQIMQCWGDPDGTNPENPGPPPEQCVSGATDAVYGGRNAALFPPGFELERIISRRDFTNFDPAVGKLDDRTGFVWMPFRAVDGTEVDTHYDPTFNPAVVGGSYWLNPYFNSITTNEIAGGRTRSNGTGAELFEVTTGLESSGLGCGQEVQPLGDGGFKEPQCWLVIVPRADPTTENDGTPFDDNSFGVTTSPLSPAAWKNRIAVPLDFNPLDSSCELADDQRRLAGSEMPVPAISSWQQALCALPDLPPFAYGTVGDAGARQQLLSGVAGAPGMVAVSRPIDPSTLDPANPVVYAPLSLSGTVIGFNLERNPKAELSAEEELLRGVRVAQLNLTPRLVAKLLTQSYGLQTAIKSTPPYDWVEGNPAHMGQDPDFLRFNPEFDLLDIASGKNFGGFVMPSRGSDAARQVWEWVLADPEARAWLDGLPDEWGMRVNPVYATTAVANSSGAPFGAPVPEVFPKSDPYCYQGPPQGIGGTIVPPPLCGTDWLPYTQSLRDAARLTRAADDGARTSADPFATSSDRVYRLDGPQILGSRTILSLTDTASANQYGLQMARLSNAGDDGSDRTFVAPDDAGLLAGVGSMRAGAVSAVLEPDPTTTSSGAYPLTALTYAATAPLTLDAPARDDYARFVEYAAGPGQVPGRELGQLPPGYVPLPADLRAEALTAARMIRDLTAAPPVAPTETPGGPAIAPPGFQSGSAPSAPVPSPPAAAAPAAVVADVAEPSGLLTPILALARNRYVLPGLAIVALLSGLGALEITKRPRRGPVGSPGSTTAVAT